MAISALSPVILARYEGTAPRDASGDGGVAPYKANHIKNLLSQKIGDAWIDSKLPFADRNSTFVLLTGFHLLFTLFLWS